MVLFGSEYTLFWVISLEIGGYKGERILGDYRGKYKIHRGSRARGSVFTSVLSPALGVFLLGFLVFWVCVSALRVFPKFLKKSYITELYKLPKHRATSKYFLQGIEKSLSLQSKTMVKHNN